MLRNKAIKLAALALSGAAVFGFAGTCAQDLLVGTYNAVITTVVSQVFPVGVTGI